MAGNYRETLNLPKEEWTIPMRANLPEQEPRWQAFWHELRLYERMLQKPAPQGDFILHDGPLTPTAISTWGTRSTRC